MIKSNFQIANEYFLEKDYMKAIEFYHKAIDNNPDIYLYYENLAWSYEEMCERNKANTYYRKTLKLKPDSFRSLRFINIENDYRKNNLVKPLVSIIVPVHNTGKYLHKCIDSILNQSLKDIEVIIINDGSKDNSREIIENFIKNDKRIILINNEVASGNPGTPRNQAIEIASGEYLGFVDSDDWIESNMYEVLYKKAKEENSDVVFSSGFNNCIGDKVEQRVYKSNFFKNRESKFYRYHESFMIWDKIFKTSMIKKYDIKLGETKAAVDVPFIFKAYYYLKKVSFCENLIAYNYRRETDTSVTVNFRKRSNCSFEIEAYNDIDSWAKSTKVDKNYQDIIDIKKLSSFVYTLSLISPSMFEEFYNKVKVLISKVERTNIDLFSIEAKKRYLYKEYEDILNLDATQYLLKNKKSSYDKPTFNIKALNKGILFFPEWTYSNPYQKLLYNELYNQYNINIVGYKPDFFTKQVLDDNRAKCDVIHLHWLHNFMHLDGENGIDKTLEIIKFGKSIGYKFIYTAHNIISHDSRNVEREISFRKKLIKEFDYVLVHGQFAKDKVVNEIKVDSSKVYIVKHGLYTNYYKNDISRKESRSFFNLRDAEFTFLFLGNIKGYKGVQPLITAFNEVFRVNKNVKLIVAGKVFDQQSNKTLENASLKNNNIIYRPGFIKDDELQLYFNAADIMVLPYKKILTSGAALLSLTFKKPVIAPNTGLLSELITKEQGLLFNSFDEMTTIMEGVIKNFKKRKFSFSSLEEELSWEKLVLKEPFRSLFHQNNVENQNNDGKVFEGRNSRLFISNDSNQVIKQHLGELKLSEDKLKKFKSNLEMRIEFCNVQAVEYSFLIAPDAHAVYKSDLPLLDFTKNIRPVEQLLSYLSEIGNIFYPLDEMKEAKKYGEVYHPVDSHWTPFGAYIVYKYLLSRLKTKVSLPKEDELKVFDKEGYGDLGDKFSPRRLGKFTECLIIKPSSVKIWNNGVTNRGHMSLWVNKKRNLKKCLLLTDSYGWKIQRFIAESFSDLYIVHSPLLEKEAINIFQPDIVISLMAERFLIYPPKDLIDKSAMDFAKEKSNDVSSYEDIESIRLKYLENGLK